MQAKQQTRLPNNHHLLFEYVDVTVPRQLEKVYTRRARRKSRVKSSGIPNTKLRVQPLEAKERGS